MQMSVLRDVMQGDQTNPKFAMNNNNRPTMPLHHRSVRTNIVLKSQVDTVPRVTAGVNGLVDYMC